MLRQSLLIMLLALPCATPALAWGGDFDIQKSLADSAAWPDLSPDTRAELDKFYALRGYRAAWNLSDDSEVKKTLAFIDSVNELVTYHGLTKSGYAIAEMRKLTASKSDDDKNTLELMITSSLLRLAHDLHGDTVDLDHLYAGWNFHRQPEDLTAQLGTALTDGKLDAFFDRLSPQNHAYQDLAKALQEYRAMEAKGGWAPIGPGPNLLPNDHSPRVAALRARLAAENYIPVGANTEADNVLDDTLDKALIAYQTRNGLVPDGHVGVKTQEALDTPIVLRIHQIRANMERWRHMPEDFPPDRFTMVNIPDFSVTIVENSGVVYRGIVIDGRPDRQTPFINSKIINMLVNPAWHVPIKIARKDILPKLRKNPHYLEKLGAVIAGRTDDPAGTTIDWQHMDDADFRFQLRQEPGDLNSLGQLKFNFFNPFDVYMHGTPHQELFERAERDFSSGCVRLEDPVRFGEIMMEFNKDKGGWNQQRILEEIDAGKTHFVTLAKPMPIYFLYWSVLTTDDGELNFRKDIYGYDQKLIEKMKEVVTASPETNN
jgi:murein L,D-transpeptidase YcbB/YkuD